MSFHVYPDPPEGDDVVVECGRWQRGAPPAPGRVVLHRKREALDVGAGLVLLAEPDGCGHAQALVDAARRYLLAQGRPITKEGT